MSESRPIYNDEAQQQEGFGSRNMVQRVDEFVADINPAEVSSRIALETMLRNNLANRPIGKRIAGKMTGFDNELITRRLGPDFAQRDHHQDLLAAEIFGRNGQDHGRLYADAADYITDTRANPWEDPKAVDFLKALHGKWKDLSRPIMGKRIPAIRGLYVADALELLGEETAARLVLSGENSQNYPEGSEMYGALRSLVAEGVVLTSPDFRQRLFSHIVESDQAEAIKHANHLIRGMVMNMRVRGSDIGAHNLLRRNLGNDTGDNELERVSADLGLLRSHTGLKQKVEELEAAELEQNKKGGSAKAKKKWWQRR